MIYEPVFDPTDEDLDRIYADCASRHPSYYWPDTSFPERYDRSIYNCILCEYMYSSEDSKSRGFMIRCADILGVAGGGETADEAIADMKSAIETIICDGSGGIYVGTSDYAFQEAEWAKFEEYMATDGMVVVHKTYIQLAAVDVVPMIL